MPKQHRHGMDGWIFDTNIPQVICCGFVVVVQRCADNIALRGDIGESHIYSRRRGGIATRSVDDRGRRTRALCALADGGR